MQVVVVGFQRMKEWNGKGCDYDKPAGDLGSKWKALPSFQGEDAGPRCDEGQHREADLVCDQKEV